MRALLATMTLALTGMTAFAAVEHVHRRATDAEMQSALQRIVRLEIIARERVMWEPAPKPFQSALAPEIGDPIPPIKTGVAGAGFPLSPALRARVFPANAVQRGQFRDRRRTHRHAGLDLAGQCGSPIVASYAGVVLPAPGRDRGYGPIVRVVKGDDGLVYRYAHLRSARVRAGQRVATGEQIGTMGRAGGLCHLHAEIVPWPEYRRRPYGVHSLDPNKLFGGSRGAHMIAAAPMPGGVTRLASLDPAATAERPRVRRPHARRTHHRHYRTRTA